jgi:hypothetical protein
MNFGKLLIAGKSVINSGRAAAYHENRRVYVPKFASPQKTFARAVPPPRAPVEKAPFQSAPIKSITPIPASSPKSVSPFAPAKSAVAPPSPSNPMSWAARLNPVAMFRGASAPSGRSVKAEQTELSLDTVKVIQNDLNDAEVDVAPIESRSNRSVETSPAGTWGSLGAKIFRTNTV